MVQKKELELGTLLFDIAGHPTADVYAVATIDGTIKLLSADKGITETHTISHHKESCRRVVFSRFDSKTIVSISSDKSLAQFDSDALKCVRAFKDAHENPLYSVCEVREHIIATGDDEGVIKLWDTRKPDAILTEPEHSNFISALETEDSGSTLLAASGDGMLSVWNSRQRKLIARSDECDMELLTCTVVRNNTKVVCGDGDGVLNVFTWGDWGDISNRIPIQDEVSIDKVLKYSDEALVMGCMDGIIRATTVFPHVSLSHVGDHNENPIEGLCLSYDSSQILSIGHDYFVRGWNTNKLNDNIDNALNPEDEGDTDEEEDEKPLRKKQKQLSAKEIKNEEAKEFFSELA